VLYHPGKNEIHEVKVEPEEKSRNDHHNGCTVHLIPRRPRDFFDFSPNAFQEIGKPFVPSDFFTHSLTFTLDKTW
jgi:hypothetical protein